MVCPHSFISHVLSALLTSVSQTLSHCWQDLHPHGSSEGPTVQFSLILILSEHQIRCQWLFPQAATLSDTPLCQLDKRKDERQRQAWEGEWGRSCAAGALKPTGAGANG